MEMWRRRGEAASARLSAALYSVYHDLYSEAVSSIASAVALAEVGLFRETVQYVQRAAKALYESAREVFEQVEVSLQRLAELIILYAERREKRARERIDKLAGVLAGVSREEVWGIAQFVLSDMYCLARDCARDEVMRKFVATVLMMLDKALRGEFSREKALFIFGEIYAMAVAGHGTVETQSVMLTVGGELGGGAALLRLATLNLLNQPLSDELKFYARIYVEKDRYYRIATYGENAAMFKRLLAVTASSAGAGYLSEKFNAGVSAEVKKEGGRDVWYVEVTTDKLAAGRAELRNALAEVVREALAWGWVDANEAERWLEELEKGRVLKEGWQEYEVGLSSGGALVVRYRSTNSDSIKQVAQRFREIGLEEGRHFSMKMLEEGREGYVYIRREGSACAAWLSEHGSGR